MSFQQPLLCVPVELEKGEEVRVKQFSSYAKGEESRYVQSRKDGSMLRKATLIMIVMAVCSLAANAETVWWNPAISWEANEEPHTFGFVHHDNNDANAPSSESVANGVFTQIDSNKWHGHALTEFTTTPAWDSTDVTFEIRFKFEGNDGDIALFHIAARNLRARSITLTSVNGDHKLQTNGSDMVDIAEGWNIMRVYLPAPSNPSAAKLWVLPGGELSGNGGAWDAASVVPVTETWDGSGSSVTWLMMGGSMSVDYVRRNNAGEVAPIAVPEPTTVALLGVGSLYACFRRR